jgi:hypothetical protein
MSYELNEEYLYSLGFESQPNNTETFKDYYNKPARLVISQHFGKVSIETYLLDETLNDSCIQRTLVSDFIPESDEDLIFLLSHIGEFNRRIKLISKTVQSANYI